MRESEPTVMIGHSRIYYRQAGPAGADILLLHGKSFTSDTWHSLGTVALLAENGWRATAVDLPGAGRSGDCDLEKGAFLSGFMDAVGISTALLVAPSFSGWYAFAFMTAHPERVSGFVGVAPRGIRTYRDRLYRIAAPVLAIWGEHDDVVPPERADELITAVPDGRKIIMAGGSHAPYMGNPEAFHAHLLAFVRQCRRPMAATGR